MLWFDVVILADPRLRGADARCLAALLEAAAATGYRVALLAMHGPAPGGLSGFAPALRRLLASGTISWLDTDSEIETRLALIYHVRPLAQARVGRASIHAEQCLLRLDQPPLSAAGEPLFDLRLVAAQAETCFGLRPEIVAADPFVAQAVENAHASLEMDRAIWPPATLLPGPPPDPLPTGMRRIGRHCLGGAGAAPDDAAALLLAYPASRGYEVHLAEAAVALVEPLERVPAGWRLHQGELRDPAAFLAGLDAYVLATSAAWRPFVLPGLVEALATAPALVLPRVLEPFFGEAAAYVDEAEQVIERLESLDEPRALACRRAAEALHQRMSGQEAVAARLRARIGPPTPSPPRLTLRRELRAQRNVLFLSPNGVGMGHLTRLLAIARHGSGSIRPVFLSMSQAVGVVEGFGYPGEYFPYHTHTGETPEAWSEALHARLNEAIAFYDARCVVFDGNVPYMGLTSARLDNPNRPFVWIRRGMWRAEAGRATIDRERYFDLVIEPGELAAEDDPGITAARPGNVARVAPITLFEPAELLKRNAARAELGLDPDRLAVIVQLGARNNFDYGQVDRIVLDTLGERPDVQLVFLEWLIGDRESKLPPHVQRLQVFPAARYLRAFDFAISACGYNSFHELLSLGIPSILVPNENPMMDAQEVRAFWADRHGHALCVRQHEAYRLAWALDRLLDDGVRRRIADRARGLPSCNGAAEAATLIAELAATRTSPTSIDRPGHSLPRPL